MKQVRVVVKENVSPERVDLMALNNKWQFHRIILPTHNNPYEKIWFTPDNETSIHYIEDFLLNIRYLLVKGEDSVKVISQIRASLDTYDRDDIRQMVENAVDRNQLIYAIYHVGVTAPQVFDPELFKYFENMLTHPDSEVRRAAIFATAYAAWPEFREYLERLQSSDPEPAVREYAKLMLASHIKHAWGSNN